METTEVIIARLVLGYLKEEKCRTAYKEFLIMSQHLQSDLGKKTKYLPTRFVGLTLTDILCEYFEISKIVQGRLEATNFYNECHSRTSLVQQLLYLLSKGHSSRTSTPCPRSPLESNLDETSPSHVDHISDVETTPAHTLPGNIRCTSEDSYLYKTPRRRSNSKLSKSATVANLQMTEKEDMSEVLAHALLENKEFHEKIAQTINKVAEKQYRFSSELDRTIKTVVKETEADPIFDKILDEIIGSTANLENCKGIETSSTTSSTAKDTIGDVRNKSKRTQKRLSSEHSEENLNHRVEMHSNFQTVEQQNDEAIRSIVANSNLKPGLQENVQEVQVNNEVTVFNGSLDKYLTSNTCHANTQTQPLQNPLYINTTGSLLMVPSGITSNPNLQIDSTKQYYLVNKQPTVNWNIPSIQTTNIITEQDILAMPTVIVSDERQNKATTLLQTPVLTSKPKLPTIAPKPTVEIPAGCLSDYSENDILQQIPQQTGLKNVVYPKTTKMTKTKEKTVGTVSCQTTKEVDTLVAPIIKKSLPSDLLEQGEETLSKTSNILQVNVKSNGEQKTNREQTPPLVVERAQKTPRSGSHVRNLDFSTPPKMTSTHKKSSKNNYVASKSPTFIHKKQAAKILFNSQNRMSNNENKTSKNFRERKTWDADLRASILPAEEQKFTCNSSRKKKKSPVKKGKKVKKGKITKKQLNATEENAALIEAALQTPIKSDSGNCTNSEQIKKENHDNKANDEGKNSNDSETNVLRNNDTVMKLPEGQVKQPNECRTNKMVLSPSKLNANKRKLIEPDVTDNHDANNSVKLVDETNKFITPEMVKENFHYPIKANRNITPMLETPLKNDFPKTPGSPNTSINTPFTKMLEANLKGIDISSLPTPNIPITPNFPPFTPNVEISSPYSNRPTDYSTSSSYYQPSDSEPNRSLEANVIELEKRSGAGHNDAVVTEKMEFQENKLENTEGKSNTVKIINTVDERLKIFNGNIIGKKNLNLVKRNISSNSSSSDLSSESSNDEDTIRSYNWVEKSNDTVICNKKAAETPRRIYSLRNRTTTTTINKKEVTMTSKVKEFVNKQSKKDAKTNVSSASSSVHKQIDEESNTSRESEKSMQKQVRHDENVFVEEKKLIENSYSHSAALQKELHEKLSRTVNKIKTAEKRTKKNSTKPLRNTKNKFMKIKLIPGLAKRKEKSETSFKKDIEKETTNMEEDWSNTKSDSPISQYENKSDSREEKTISMATIKDSEKIDKTASDIEAQNLIEGLKERELIKDPDNETNVSKCVIESNSCKESQDDQHEKSTTELETEWRETYDTMTFEGEYECVVYDETKKTTKTFEDFDITVLEKNFVGKVFIEEINEVIGIPLVVSPLYTLLDIPPSRNLMQKQNVSSQKAKIVDKKTGEKTVNKDFPEKNDTNKKNPVSEGDQMNRTVMGSSREDKEGSEPPNTKKRKVEKEDCRVPEEKECKILLQQINVDTFLNNIYGNS